MIKRILSAIVISAVLFNGIHVEASDNVSNSESVDNQEYFYECSNGDIIGYYLDKDGIPFRYEDGKIKYIFLPLERFKVTDDDIIWSIDDKTSESNKIVYNRSGEPSNYYDISSGTLYSPRYSLDANFTQATTWATEYLKLNTSHPTFRFKTKNSIRAFPYNSGKIDYTIYFYDSTDSLWYSYSFTEKYCEGDGGESFDMGVGGIYTYARVLFSTTHLISTTVEAWTTM